MNDEINVKDGKLKVMLKHKFKLLFYQFQIIGF